MKKIILKLLVISLIAVGGAVALQACGSSGSSTTTSTDTSTSTFTLKGAASAN